MKNAEAAISSQGAGGSKKFEDWGRLKNYRTGVTFAGGGGCPLHAMAWKIYLKLKWSQNQAYYAKAFTYNIIIY